jgi:molecular chaperone Hsp33
LGNKKLKDNKFDNCTSFHIGNGAFLGRLVRLDNVIDEITSRHQYPEQVNSVMAECTALAVLFAGSMKYEGLVTLQTQTDGPISMVVVDVTSKGEIRAYARYDENRIIRAQELRKTEGEIEPAPYLLGGGYIAFTIDQGKDTELYQGVVNIQGKTLSEIALRYFRQSEQIDTHIRLFTRKNRKSWEAAGMMIQKMPGEGGKDMEKDNNQEAWNEAKVLMDSMSEEEIFDHDLSSENLIHRLYYANHMVVSGIKNYRFQCRCSRDRLLNTLRSFDQKEIDAMSEKNKVTVTCDFCSNNYIFEKGELYRQ